MKKSTKARCEAFAAQHGLSLVVRGRTTDWHGVSYWIDVPDGYVLPDGTTGKDGHDLCDMTMSEVWGMVLEDLMTCVEEGWTQE